MIASLIAPFCCCQQAHFYDDVNNARLKVARDFVRAKFKKTSITIIFIQQQKMFCRLVFQNVSY